MFNFCSLYSGSNGNCLLVETDECKILIDAGESAKKIELALSNYGTSINDIDAILVTHEHTDHTKSLGTLSKKYNIPIYANKETWEAMPEQKLKIIEDNQKLYIPNKKFKIKDLEIKAFNIPHDAANPCGFNIINNGKKISVAIDLGHADETVVKNLKNSCFALIEANYDLDVLQYSKYPYYLKKRISGPDGHLSNKATGELISSLVDSGLNHVMLGHLSKENNFPELAYKSVMEELINNKINETDFLLDVAKRDSISKIIHIA